jgi:restriction system protein
MSTTTAADVPKFHELFVPVLSVLSAGGVLASRDIIAAVAGDLALSPDQRASRIPSGQRRFDNRVNWALSYLFQARAVTKHGRGRFEITDRGRKLVSPERGRVQGGRVGGVRGVP